MSNQDWHGCYDDGWKGEIHDLAFSHPAKFSRALIRRIYAYMLAQGWLKPGDTVLDPFGGVGLGAKDALANGINWIGVELEQKFVDLGAGCDCSGISKADWVRLYGRSPAGASRMNYTDGRHWCPQCLDQINKVDEPKRPLSYERKKRRGRIRELQKLLGKRLTRRVVLGQPLPLPGTALAERIQAEQQHAQQISLFGPVASESAGYERNSGRIPATGPHRFEGNLAMFRQYAQGGAWAVLLQGDSRKLVQVVREWQRCRDAGVQGAISSPPYTNTNVEKNSSGVDLRKNFETYKASGGGLDFEAYCLIQQKHSQGYGASEGQLAGLPEGQPAGAISSPPYAGSNQNYQEGWQYIDKDKLPHNQPSQNRNANYGQEDGNLSNMPEGEIEGMKDEGEVPNGLVSSPPYAAIRMDGGRIGKEGEGGMQPYTDEDSDTWFTQRDQQNLGNLRDSGFAGAIASPSFAGNTGGRGEASREGIDPALFDRHSGGMKRGTGDNPDNLDHLPDKGFDVVIGSPPYAKRTVHGDNGIDPEKLTGNTPGRGSQVMVEGYGNQPGQLANLPESGFDGVIGSPPYAGARIDGAGDEGASEVRMPDGGFPRGTEGWELRKGQDGRYGDHNGQLAGMPEGEGPHGSGGAEVQGCIASPPFADSLDRTHLPQADRRAVADKLGISNSEHVSKIDAGAANGDYGSTEGQLGAMKDKGFEGAIASPPFVDSVGSDEPERRGGLFRDPKRAGDVNLTSSYGQTPGQLGAMPSGSVSSPPFAKTDNQPTGLGQGKGTRDSGEPADRNKGDYFYPESPGQLGAMAEEAPEASISSLPYEGSVNQHALANNTEARLERMEQAGIDIDNRANVGGRYGVARQDQTYGLTEGQVGAEAGETFWSAARLIVEQCHELLASDSVSAWVVKDFVRDGERVRFGDQWRQLCEVCGFEHIETKRAWVVKEKGTQIDLEGEAVDLRVERKSFFRRLAEKKGSPRIDWEEVIFMRKPAARVARVAESVGGGSGQSAVC